MTDYCFETTKEYSDRIALNDNRPLRQIRSNKDIMNVKFPKYSPEYQADLMDSYFTRSD